MANVLFKRGTQVDLNSLIDKKVFQEGTFYLTTDTDRLYFAQSNNELVDLNRNIQTVNTIEELNTWANNPANSVQPGDFFYILNDNILCIRNATNTGWTQLNPDTKLKEEDQHNTFSTSTNSVTVKSTITDTQNNKSEGSFTVEGGGVIKVTKGEDGVIKISAEAGIDTTYKLTDEAASAAGKTGASIVLTNQSNNEDVQKINILGSGQATITQDGNGNIIVDAAGTDLEDGSASFDANGELTIGFETSTGVGTTAKVTPIIKVGENASETVKFANGTATLPVYTKSETDTKIANAIQVADAMTYRGTAASDSFLTSLVSVSKGDTYKSTFTGEINGQDVNKGDLIISNSADGTSGAAADWQVVPSGNDQLIEAEEVTNGLELTDNGLTLAKVSIAAGDNLAVTSEGTLENGKVITVSHAGPQAGTLVTKDSEAETITQGTMAELTIPVIDTVKVDEHGHISEIALNEYKVVDTHLSIESADFSRKVTNSADAKGTITDSEAEITLTIETSDGDTTSNKLNLQSNSLVFTETTGANGVVETAVNLVWGSF